MATQENNNTKIMFAKNLRASKKFPKTLIEGAVNVDMLNDEKVKSLIYEYEGVHYLNVKIVARKEASKHGATHYMEVDTFVPVKKEGE